MEDVARYYVEETGQLGEVPSNLQNYIDYQALGRDMEIEEIILSPLMEYLSILINMDYSKLAILL